MVTAETFQTRNSFANTMKEALIEALSNELTVLKSHIPSPKSVIGEQVGNITTGIATDTITDLKVSYPVIIDSITQKLDPERKFSNYNSFRIALIGSSSSFLVNFGKSIFARIAWGTSDIISRIGTATLHSWSGESHSLEAQQGVQTNLRSVILSLGARIINPNQFSDLDFAVV